MPTLTVTCDAIGLRRLITVRKERFTIGRSPTADISIPDENISEVHLVIARGPSGHTFEDLWSASGTYRNGEKQGSGVLQEGDVLRIGRAEILFRAVETKADPGPAEVPKPAERKEAFTVPGLDWRTRAPEGDLGVSAIRGRIEKENRILRIVTAHKTASVTIVLGGIALVALLMLGNMGYLYRVVQEGLRGNEEAVEIRSPARKGEAETEIAAAKAEPGRGEARDPAEEILDDLSQAPDRPYLDAGESERVLFRLFLDILGRPPTRPEVESMGMLPHRARWDAIQKLAARGGKRAAPTGAPGSVKKAASAAFRRFLGRSPKRDEERAAELLLDPKAGQTGPPGPRTDLGLLLSASDRYRSAEFRRRRGAGRMAASFVVDLLDRPPTPEEARDIENTIDEVSTAAAIGRILAYSPGGEGALASFPTPTAPLLKQRGSEAVPAGGDARAKGGGAPEGFIGWARAEARRFLLREPTAAEIGEIVAACAGARDPKDAARWTRIALAGLEEYGSY
jgi:hypothetical protein